MKQVSDSSAWRPRSQSGLADCIQFFDQYGVMLGLTSGAVMSACASAAFGLGMASEHQIIAEHLQSIAANLGVTGAVTAGSFWTLSRMAGASSGNDVFEAQRSLISDEVIDDTPEFRPGR